MHLHHRRRRSFDAFASFALLFALASCGFQGEPPFAGARISGVAPWQDLGPITLCDGAARLGPLSFGALGTCDAGSPRSCTSSAGCKSREACVCGRCARPVCDSTEECGAGQVCSFDDRVCDRACGADGDCAKGERCVPGKNICRGICKKSADCQAGESCDAPSGLCVPETCASDAECSGACTLERLPAEVAEPAPLTEGSSMTMWLEITLPMDAPAIWRATSSDGLAFNLDPPHPLLAGRAPSVLRDAAFGYLLYYATGSGSTAQVARAVSPDGITFSPDAAPLLSGDQPSAVATSSGFALYYLRPDGAIGRAESADGAHFTPADPVLTPAQASDPVLWRDVDRLASPFAQALTDPAGKPFVRLWFAGHGIESGSSEQLGKIIPTPPDFSIGEASAEDGSTLVTYPFNPVFDRVLDFLTHPSELDPAVISFGNISLLYYRRAAADGSGSENLAVARSPALPR